MTERIHRAKHLSKYEYVKTGEIIEAHGLHEVKKILKLSMKQCRSYINCMGRVHDVRHQNGG